jgi:hypothetical protein
MAVHWGRASPFYGLRESLVRREVLCNILVECCLGETNYVNKNEFK